jgi:hypothetical protein
MLLLLGLNTNKVLMVYTKTKELSEFSKILQMSICDLQINIFGISIKILLYFLMKRHVPCILGRHVV